MSTFQGLEVARKALFAQQNALYTTGHNIANVNTEGYSRQRVNFAASTPFPVPSRVQPQIPGQLGTGVDVQAVQRVRNNFLDAQFRSEHSRLGYWETRSETLNRMESLLNELNETGLSNRMDLFWQSLQDLADHPDNTGARAVVAQRGLALAETYNYFSRSLEAIREDLANQITITVDDDLSDGNITSEINLLLKNINELNKKIQEIEPHGFLANDLYDERDRLIDQLSNYMNIKVTTRASSNSPLELDIADGVVSIELLQNNGQSFEPPLYLINAGEVGDSLEDAVNYLEVQFDDENKAVSGITIGNQVDGETGLARILQSDGALSALIETYGYTENGEVIGDYPEILADLDRMAKAFAAEFNKIHEEGIDINGNSANGRPFFVAKDGGEITSGNITVNPEIVEDSNLIAAGVSGQGNRNGDNALNLANVFDQNLVDLGGASVRSFYISLIGEIGVKVQEAETMTESTKILESQIDHSRLSVSAVSLDEEISNLIKFQHAYNAAARNMTAIDELIDRIINHMGLVGR